MQSFTYSVTLMVDSDRWYSEYPEDKDMSLREAVRCSLEIAADETGTAKGAVTVVKVK